MNRHQLAEAKDVIESAGTSVSTWVCDVSDEEAVDEVFTEIAKENGRLDAVINNAGITRDALLLKVKEAQLKNG